MVYRWRPRGVCAWVGVGKDKRGRLSAPQDQDDPRAHGRFRCSLVRNGGYPPRYARTARVQQQNRYMH
jgi:hypothetical protein